MNTDTDSELWVRAASGDAGAFEVLVGRHGTSVYNYAFRSTGSWPEAEDVSAATFLELWRHRSRLVLERESILPWLLGVATNVIRNRRRSTRRHEAALLRLRAARQSAPPDPADEVAARAEDEWRMRAILRRLDQLPEKDREVIRLSAFAGLSHDQIAEALGVRPGTVKSRLSRARRRLAAADPTTPAMAGEEAR